MTSLNDVSSSEFICACDVEMRSACKAELFGKYEGRPYCIFHYPSKEKAQQFEAALETKLEEGSFDFRGIWFPSRTDFNEYQFTDDVSFISATFSEDAYFVDATFHSSAEFTRATFKGTAYFSRATFDGVEFTETIFCDVDFLSTTFGAYCNFISTIFKGNADFTSATFHSVTNFRSASVLGPLLFVKTIHKKDSAIFFALARLGDVVKFQECDFEADTPFLLEEAIFVKPEWVAFDTLALRPQWFAKVDPRDFDFIDVEWTSPEGNAVHSELQALRKRGFARPHRLLTIAYRQLAVNAEDNNRYGEAANFRFLSMRTRSLEIRHALKRLWNESGRHYLWEKLRQIWATIDPLHSIYGIVSGYGESVGRAIAVLTVVWLLFAWCYWRSDPTWWQVKTNIHSSTEARTIPTQLLPTRSNWTFRDALVYSGSVLTLQKPEPSPGNKRAKAIVLVETILGPVQAALVALAIRRKFMR